MLRFTNLLLSVLIICLFAPGIAQAADGESASTEAELLRQELEQLKEDYQERILAIEKRLQQLEGRPPALAAQPESARTPVDAQGTAAGESEAVSQEAKAEKKARQEEANEFAREQFIDPTEEYERVLSLDQSSSYMDQVEKVLQDYIDFGGYFRAGYGRNNQGGPQVAFQAPGAAAKYRLGNEAENYGELILGKSWWVPGMFSADPTERPNGTPKGPVARAQFRISFYNPYNDFGTGSGTDVALPEAWAAIGNVIGGQPSLKFWAGNRFYRRYDIHIDDFFFYNMSGGGGGFEDLELPFGKVAVAWLGTGSQSSISSVPEPEPENKAGFSKNNWDFRLYEVPLPLGTGEIGVAYARADAGLDQDGNTVEPTDGVAFNFVHTKLGIIAADDLNQFSLQAGFGPAMTFTSGFETYTATNGLTFIRPDSQDSWRFRVTENMVLQPCKVLSISPLVLYEYTDNADLGGVEQWLSGGVRPILHFSDYLGLAFEGGVDWTKSNATGMSGNLYKLTVAPQVSLGDRFFSRPVIRFYWTYAAWSEDFMGHVGGFDYAQDTDGWAAGVQMETWW